MGGLGLYKFSYTKSLETQLNYLTATKERQKKNRLWKKEKVWRRKTADRIFGSGGQEKPSHRDETQGHNNTRDLCGKVVFLTTTATWWQGAVAQLIDRRKIRWGWLLNGPLCKFTCICYLDLLSDLVFLTLISVSKNIVPFSKNIILKKIQAASKWLILK